MDIYPEVVMEMHFLLLYISNVAVASQVIPLVTIPFLDFVMIHQIHWNLFREFS